MSIYEVIQSVAGLAIAGTFILQYRLNRMQAIQLRLSSMPIISVQYEEEEEEDAFFDQHIRDAGLLRIKAVKNVIYELWWESIDRKDLVFDTNGLSNMMEGDTYIKRFSHDKGGLPLDYHILLSERILRILQVINIYKISSIGKGNSCQMRQK